jgi:dTMP kinase
MIPRYVAFEGIDGTGKSLQMTLLAQFLTKRGITPIHLYEPSYGVYGREIRKRLVDGTIGSMAEQEELFTRDRRDHVERKIRPLLDFVQKAPDFVILQSRSYLSAAAYQSEEMELDRLVEIVARQQFAPRPDFIFILDAPVEVAIERLQRDGRADSFETASQLERARSRYLKLAESCPQYILVEASGRPVEAASVIQRAMGLHGAGERT